MLEQDLLIGGEESGGIGIRPHLPERDGILNSLLLAEILATESKPLADCVAELHREFGPHHYRRIDLSLEPRQKHRAVQYVSRPTLTRIGDWNVSGREDLDGTKLYLALETTPVTPSGSRGVGQSAWVLVRASGTEPLVRVYAEAPEAVLAERIAASVAALLRSV
jgi:phosphomannomutase